MNDTDTAVRAQVYKVSQVAEILMCDPQTVYRLIKEERLKAVHLGRVIRVTQAAINDFLDS